MSLAASAHRHELAAGGRFTAELVTERAREAGVTDGLTSVYLDRPTVQGARGGGESETWLLYGGTANEARSISYGHAPPLPPPTRASADRSDTACFHFSVVF